VKIQIVGGDRRNLCLYERLRKDYETYLYGCGSGEEEWLANEADVVIGPLPLTVDKRNLYMPYTDELFQISDFFQRFSTARIVTGPVKDPEERVFNITGHPFYSYRNVVPTSEGIIRILMDHSDRTISGSNILIVGYGRIGRKLMELLQCLGAHTSVMTTKEEEARDLRWGGVKTFSSDLLSAVNLDSWDVIINTVPAVLFSRSVLERIGSSVLLLNIASGPGGFDQETIREKQLRYVNARGIPGSYAPGTAADNILWILRNEGILPDKPDKAMAL